MSYPLVSVVMISYNHAEYLENAIRGVLSQIYNGQIELIIANDNSPDHSDEVILNLVNLSTNKIVIKYTKHQKNKGMMKNFSWALSEAKGEYVALCDGDDYWIDPYKVQKQVDFLEKNSDYLIHSGNAQVLKNGILGEFVRMQLGQNTCSFNDFLTKNNLATCTVMYRNKPIDITIFNDIIFGDWMLYIYLLSQDKSKKAWIDNDVFSVYRVHDKGIMSSISQFQLNEQHINQTKRILKNFNVKFSSKDCEIINRFSVNSFKYLIYHHQYLKSLTVFFRNFLLTKSQMNYRNYLGVLRYKNLIKNTFGG